MSKIVIKYNYKSNLKEFTMGFLWCGNKKKKNEKAGVTEPATNEQETELWEFDTLRERNDFLTW